MTPDSASNSTLPESGWMARALELAERGLYTTDPNPRVGCVLVRDGQVVGEGWHARAGEPHAEVMALRAAAGRARGAVAYVTLEPCCHTGRTPPCADALIAAGITHVVCAAVDPNPKVGGGGINRLEAAGIAVTVGLLATEARALNIGFFSRFERRRPFIRLKLAMSLDARTAQSGGGSAWITDEASRADVQVWRARSSAILTGAGTVRVDDPRLDVRLDYGPWVRQPLRVVLDTDLTCPPTSKVFHDGHALIFAANDAPERSGAPERGGIPERSGMSLRTERVPRAPRGLDIEAVLARLVLLEVNELLVECGPRLAAAFLEANLVDELILYVAPHFLGMDAPPLAALAGLENARRLSRFQFHEQRMIDNDLRLVLTPKGA
ncbi:MAG TPA: bifunctional diaminohydroxyphosphoribosylaminopyrimidine deaminase/5-amino-6-(5-phosphoribosylamino)uracil reductase RibD [Steroidobacteraceae bacterium]|nr:bifunctional diaminohydroxyphosphoribosylaminopyrimidine deaminase/5-amino-6-(5-phosphoribosylamino)uracil reductase RibD [Steroidobacteraceae bacterium]